MSRHRRRDRDRIDSWVLQNVCVVRGRFDFRVTAPGKGEAILPEVRDGNQLGFRSLDEIADEIRTPVPVANNTDTNQVEPPLRTKSMNFGRLRFAKVARFRPSWDSCQYSGWLMAR